MNNLFLKFQKHSPEVFDKSPKERNELVYIPKFLCQGSLPKTHQKVSEWKRSTKSFNYTVIAPSRFGVPGGSYSRLIILMLNTIAKFSKSPTISIGNFRSEFMQSIGLEQHGKINTEFDKHFLSSINSVFHIEKYDGTEVTYSIQPLIESAKTKNNNWNWSAEITLSDTFYEASQKSAPTDLGALKCLAPGTLRMDIFNFLVYRLYYLKSDTRISWRELYAMFATPNIEMRYFKRDFKKALFQAKSFYLDANAETDKWGLYLKKSKHLIRSTNKSFKKV